MAKNQLGSYLVRLRPRPVHLQVSRGRTVLVANREGLIQGGVGEGLFVHQTRLLSRWEYRIDKIQPLAVAVSSVQQHSWLGYYIAAAPGVDPGPPDLGSGEMEALSEETLELKISRFVGEGLHEDIDLTNYSLEPIEFDLEIFFDADFASPTETRQSKRIQHGTLTGKWQGEVEPGRWEYIFDYRAEHTYHHQDESGHAFLHRGMKLQILKADSVPKYKSKKLIFPVRLDPGKSWHTCVEVRAHIDGNDLPLQRYCTSFEPQDNEYDRKQMVFLLEASRFQSPESETLTPLVLGALSQAREDLMALRLFDIDKSAREWVMAAGVPLYLALFGRDTLTAAWMASILDPGMMSGVLYELVKWQGTKKCDWRDEDPGRMLHEAHTGPLESLNFNPRSRYYGSVTTSGFYPFVLSELWHWTGDVELVKPLLEPTMKAIAWKETQDVNGDGLYEYQTRSIMGTRNQAWKDSWNAIVYEDGRIVDTPITAVEEQAFFYLAKLQLSELLFWLDRKHEAKKMFDEAYELRQRINEHLWMPKENFYAVALDPQRRQVSSIASNAGHVLAAGVPEREMVPAIADRLMSEELYSGWGIRTLSEKHPAYDPFSYHRGTVWPVEQGAFALGFARYGLYDHLHRLCKSMFETAAIFDFHRLPECFTGHRRDEAHPFPAFYPRSNYPQAWSAAALFAMIQAMVGVYPYAPLELLLIDPHLPDWLPNLTLTNLKVGKGSIDIRFHRAKDGSSHYEILDVRGTLHVLRQPSPWSLSATWGERIKDVLMSLLPGR
jgi:glycogen debranching enzyme